MAELKDDATWECPEDRTRRARDWIASADKPPVEEFRKAIRPLFEWYDVRTFDESIVDPDVVQALATVGMRPRWRYWTASRLSVAGIEGGGPLEVVREHWCSDDGITTATVPIGAGVPSLVVFETRFEGPTMFVDRLGEPSVRNPIVVYHELTGDFRVDYASHRRRVAARIEAGDRALHVGDLEDARAWSLYWADHHSAREIWDQVQAIAGRKRESPWGWVALAAVMIAALPVGAWMGMGVSEGLGAWLIFLFLLYATGALSSRTDSGSSRSRLVGRGRKQGRGEIEIDRHSEIESPRHGR